MALYLQPFIYMIRPRSYKLTRVDEEESQGNNVRIKMDKNK
jgi:hypothetical protein